MRYIIILIVTFLSTGCGKEKSIDPTPKEPKLIRDIAKLKYFSTTYAPFEIDISKNKDLKAFDLEYIFNDKSYTNHKNLKDEIVNILLLKQYLYHISNANHGFDLLQMRKGQVKFLIDYYIKLIKLGLILKCSTVDIFMIK